MKRTAIHYADKVDDNPTRWALMSLSEIAKNAQFTELLKERVDALKWEEEEGRYTLIFVMKGKDNEGEMMKLLPVLFDRLKKGVEKEVGITLYNVRTATAL